MTTHTNRSAFILGLSLIIGMVGLGYLLADAALQVKQFDRSVTVKGLSEREYPADVVIWPIQFTAASNDVQSLYQAMEKSSHKIKQFLLQQGVNAEEISASVPAITDKLAQQYSSGNASDLRYTGSQSVTVYSSRIDAIRAVMNELPQLGKQGIVMSGDSYESKTQYLFTKLNDIKPAMIAEATQNAREVAQKFADDSDSQLGKIKSASQGQFSIEARDNNNPQVKKVRVVSTIQYYLSD
jgi:hypothetical protein